MFRKFVRKKFVRIFRSLPSDTKLLLTKNYSEIIIFGKITNLTRNFSKISFIPGDFESSKPLKNYEKSFSGNYFRNNFVSEGNPGLPLKMRRKKGRKIQKWQFSRCPFWKPFLGTYSCLFEPISGWEVVVQATNKPLISH